MVAATRMEEGRKREAEQEKEGQNKSEYKIGRMLVPAVLPLVSNAKLLADDASAPRRRVSSSTAAAAAQATVL